MYKKIAVILLVAVVSFFAGCKSDEPVTPTNKAPDAPNTPTPSDGAVNVPHLVTLSWKCTDPDGDQLKYDVNWGYDTNVTNEAGKDLTASTVSILQPLSGKVYWKVVAKDPSGASTAGPVWSFTTVP